MPEEWGGPLPPGTAPYPFVGVPTFLRAPLVTDPSQLDADIAVIGVPTDEGSPFLPGSRFAPRSIREHSLRFGPGGYYDPRLKRSFLDYEMSRRRIADLGDAQVVPTSVEQTFQNITDLVRGVLARGALPVVLGGDHAISFPVVRAYEQPLYVVHFDAHIDYAPFVHGWEYTNWHVFRQVRRLPTVQGLIQVGIRSLRNPGAWIEDSVREGNRVLNMEEFRALGPGGLARLLPQGAPCYVSIDIDALDLSLVPGCVSAEPNGMAYHELRDALFALAEHARIVGFDLVEVNPMLDVGTGVTSYLAAHLVLEFLGCICAQPWWKARRGRGARGPG